MTADDLVLSPLGLRYRGRLYPCSIGTGGIRRNKREGDRATPVGVHGIVGMLYRPDRMRPPTPWATLIGPRDVWCDDPGDHRYNHMATAPLAASHEKLRRADPLYDLILVTDWNWPDAVAGKGSAIFLHQWRRPGYPTEGCVALSRSDLHRIATSLKPNARLIVKDQP